MTRPPTEAAWKRIMLARPVEASIAFILISAASGLAAEAQRNFTPDKLESRGATEVANGRLIQESIVTCLPLRGAGEGCGEPKIKYGSFRRLRLDGTEFVCISFPTWKCYESK